MRDAAALPDWPRGMRLPLAAAYVGVSESWWLDAVKADRAPKPHHPSPGVAIWLREELDAWLDRCAGRENHSPSGPGAEEVSRADAEAEWERALGGTR